MVTVGLSWLFNSRCWQNHSGPEGVWSSGVIRSGVGRLLYRGGQGRWSKSGLWRSHSSRREGPPVQDQVVYISRSNQPLLFFGVTCSIWRCSNFQGYFWSVSWQTGIHCRAVRGRPAFVWKPGSPPLQKCKMLPRAFLNTSMDRSQQTAPRLPT